MPLVILVIIVAVAVIYVLNSKRSLNRNERLYLKRRGYERPIEFDEGPPVSKDTRLLNTLESLSDISPFARQRAAEDLSRMCASGQRDPRMLSSLIEALDDSDAAVRGAVAMALARLGDQAAVEPLKRRVEIEESIPVRVSLEQALKTLQGHSV
jgi:HEAT repeats